MSLKNSFKSINLNNLNNSIKLNKYFNLINSNKYNRNNRFLNDKKGISFFYTIVPFMLILMVLLIITYVSPNSSIPSNFDFGKSVEYIDLINYKFIAEQFYKDEFIKETIEKSLIDFSKFQIIEDFDFDRNKLQGCNIDGLILWYNEKNINDKLEKDIQASSTKIKNNEENKNLENDDSKNDISYKTAQYIKDINDFEYNENEILTEEKNENEKEISKTISKQKDIDVSCIPKFENDIEDKISQEIEKNLKNDMTKISKIQDLNKYEVNSVFNDETSNYEIEILTDYSKETLSESKIELKYNYKLDFDVGNYINLLKTLKKIIPQISTNFKDSVPECIDKNQEKNIKNLELFCFKNIILEMIKNQAGNKLLDEFNYEISFIDKVNDMNKEENSKEYFGLEFLISSKTNIGLDLRFGLILEDNIPNNLINFNLKNFEKLDNAIEVIIEEPKFNSKNIDKYIVLYSYQNFFDKSYSKYEELLKLLQERRIPNDFVNTGFSDFYNSKYYYSSKESGLNLNLLNVESSNFIDLETNTKKILIFQTFDYEKNEYKLLDNNLLYVYVFGVDKNNNYYVNNILGKTIAIIPKPQFGPNPLSDKNKDKISGTKEGIQNSIYVKIKDYNDINFDHYDLYLRKAIDKNFNLKSCGQTEEECYYYNGMATLREPNLEFYITSDLNFEIPSNSNLIFTNEFSKFDSIELKLENNQKYDLAIIPVDINGNSVLINSPKEFEYISGGKGFYNIGLGGKNNEIEIQSRPFIEKNIEVKDKKIPSPKPDVAISINPANSFINGVLQWTPIEDIIKLRAEVILKKADGTTISTNVDENIGLNGIVTKTTDTCTIIINKIMPVDSSGNSYAPNEYLGSDYYQFTNSIENC